MNTYFPPATGRHHLYRSEFAFHRNCQITEPLLFHRSLNGLDFSDKSTQVHSPVRLLMKQSMDRSIEGSVIPECVYLSTALFWQLSLFKIMQQLSLFKIMQPCIEQGTWGTSWNNVQNNYLSRTIMWPFIYLPFSDFKCFLVLYMRTAPAFNCLPTEYFY